MSSLRRGCASCSSLYPQRLAECPQRLLRRSDSWTQLASRKGRVTRGQWCGRGSEFRTDPRNHIRENGYTDVSESWTRFSRAPFTKPSRLTGKFAKALSPFCGSGTWGCGRERRRNEILCKHRAWLFLFLFDVICWAGEYRLEKIQETEPNHSDFGISVWTTVQASCWEQP